MKKFLLLKSRMNQAHKEIQNQGLNPDEFEWTERTEERIPMVVDAGNISVLVHRSTGFSFSFDLRGDRAAAEFAPGQDRPRCYEICENLPQLMGFFVTEWLPSLKREIEAPDLWAELSSAATLAEAAQTADDTAFTPEQHEHLVRGIAEIKVWILEQTEAHRQHAEFVTERLAYLESTIDRVPRNVWGHTAIGVLVTIAVGTGFDAEQARELFRTASNALSHVVAGAAKFLQ